jgi:putative heme-binding domain-containing protein
MVKNVPGNWERSNFWQLWRPVVKWRKSPKRTTLRAACLAICLTMCVVWSVLRPRDIDAYGQQPVTPTTIRNPLAGNLGAIQHGADAYRVRCGECHGSDASGTARGSDVAKLWSHGASDESTFVSTRKGITNTLLPHSFGPDDEVWAIVAYLRSLDRDENRGASSAGDSSRGAQIFAENCSSCHQVGQAGGHLGPDLSRIGGSRSVLLLEHKIRHASAYIYNLYRGGYVFDGYSPVSLVTSTGERIRGVKKNEDAFSIQIMDAQERLQGYKKDALRKWSNDTTSLMPDFGVDKVSESAMRDLLAYLVRLDGTSTTNRGE